MHPAVLQKGIYQLAVAQLIKGAVAVAAFIRSVCQEGEQCVVNLAGQPIAYLAVGLLNQAAQRLFIRLAVGLLGHQAGNGLGGNNASIEIDTYVTEVGCEVHFVGFLRQFQRRHQRRWRAHHGNDPVAVAAAAMGSNIFPLVFLNGPDVGALPLTGDIRLRLEAHPRRKGARCCVCSEADAVHTKAETAPYFFCIGPLQVDHVVVGDSPCRHRTKPSFAGVTAW